MTATPIPPDMTAASLTQRWHGLESDLPDNLNLRLRRATSWLVHAELNAEDPDSKFIFNWIGFNSIYSSQGTEDQQMPARERFGEFFERMIELDANNMIHGALHERFSDSVGRLLNNRYVYAPFWWSQNGRQGLYAWEGMLQRRNLRARMAISGRLTADFLDALFDSLYVLRNQLLHGSATWGGSVNRQQVEDGAEIMAFLVPRFIRLMIDNPDVDWGAPSYPPVPAA